MKRSIKLMLVIFILLVMCCSIMNSTYASSFKLSLGASATTVKPEESVTIDLKLSSIDAGEIGINTIEAVVSYDENVFEPIKQGNFAGSNNWSITYNSEEGENKGKFVAVILQNGVTQDQTIGKLTLKVKSGISDTTSKVSFTGIKTNDGTNEITAESQSVSIKVSSASANDKDSNGGTTGQTNSGNNQGTPTNPGSQEGNGTGSATDAGGSATPTTGSEAGTSSPSPATSSSVATPTTGSTSTTNAPTKLPYAGNSHIVIISAIVISLVVAIITYKCYKRLRQI